MSFPKTGFHFLGSCSRDWLTSLGNETDAQEAAESAAADWILLRRHDLFRKPVPNVGSIL
jgi:hypothetical protein